MMKLTESMQAMHLAMQGMQQGVQSIQSDTSKMKTEMEELHRKVADHEQKLQAQSITVAGGQAFKMGTDADFTVKSTNPNFVIGPQVAEMIQNTLRDQVAPVMRACFAAQETRISQLEQDVQKMKQRTAWLERDSMDVQIRIAKTQVVCRGWQEWMTVQDRKLSVFEAAHEAGIHSNSYEVHTGVFDHATEVGKKVLSNVTVINFSHFEHRKKFLDHCWDKHRGGSVFWAQWWKETKITEKKTVPKMAERDAPDPFDPENKTVKEVYDTGETEEIEEESQTWSKEMTAQRIKVTPGNTQYERRLCAPFHQMMNAYTEAFPQYKGQRLKAHWKTLILTDPHDNSWMGRVKYVRERSTDSFQAQSTADWKCVIMLPDSHYDRVMEQWKKGWYSQLKKQMELTDTEDASIQGLSQGTAESYGTVARYTSFMRKMKPDWDGNTELGMQEWVARFKWEFPWKVQFERTAAQEEERKHWSTIRTADELMVLLQLLMFLCCCCCCCCCWLLLLLLLLWLLLLL